MSKKRSKKYNPKKIIQQNAWMLEDYIVFSVDSIAMGVRYKKTGEVVGVGNQAYNALQHGICARNVYYGVLYKDDTGVQQIEIEIAELSRCSGPDAMEIVNERTRAICHRVRAEKLMGRFYFITGDLSYDWDDATIYQWLDECNAFDLLLTREEYVRLEYQDMEDYMTKFDPKKTQIGGDHYSRLAVQPIEVINLCRLNWYMANAFKYVARHRFKNKQQDLMKAYDYIMRAVHEGYAGFFQPRRLPDAELKLCQFLKQFDDSRQQRVLRDICTLSKRRFPKDGKKWAESMSVLLFDLNELCKVDYGTNAF